MTEAEKKVLLRAHRKIQELRANRSLMTRLSYSVNFDDKEQEGDSGLQSRPDINSVKAAATDIRHFLMPGSSIVWGGVMKICLKNIPIEKRPDLRLLGRAWSQEAGYRGGNTGLGMKLSLNGKSITRRQLIELWMNGDIFHLDEQETARVAFIRDNPQLHIVEMMFIASLQDLTRLLVILDRHYIEPILQTDVDSVG